MKPRRGIVHKKIMRWLGGMARIEASLCKYGKMGNHNSYYWKRVTCRRCLRKRKDVAAEKAAIDMGEDVPGGLVDA